MEGRQDRLEGNERGKVGKVRKEGIKCRKTKEERRQNSNQGLEVQLQLRFLLQSPSFPELKTTHLLSLCSMSSGSYYVSFPSSPLFLSRSPSFPLSLFHFVNTRPWLVSGNLDIHLSIPCIHLSTYISIYPHIHPLPIYSHVLIYPTSVHSCIYLSIHLLTHPLTHPPIIQPPTYPSTHLPTYKSTHPPTNSSTHQCNYPPRSIQPPIYHPPIYLSIHLASQPFTIYSPIYPFTHLYIHWYILPSSYSLLIYRPIYLHS